MIILFMAPHLIRTEGAFSSLQMLAFITSTHACKHTVVHMCAYLCRCAHSGMHVCVPPKPRHVCTQTLVHRLELYALLVKGWWKKEERYTKLEEVKKKRETVLTERRWDMDHTAHSFNTKYLHQEQRVLLKLLCVVHVRSSFSQFIFLGLFHLVILTSSCSLLLFSILIIVIIIK